MHFSKKSNFILAVFLLFLTSLFFSPNAICEEVKLIHSDGRMELRNGDKIYLAGIHLAPEALRILPTLLAGQEVSMQNEKSLARLSNGEAPVYLFVKTKELDLPYRPTATPTEKKVMVNEILIKTGAANVLAGLRFKNKEDFLRLEATARRQGQGIWSYETLEGEEPLALVDEAGGGIPQSAVN